MSALACVSSWIRASLIELTYDHDDDDDDDSNADNDLIRAFSEGSKITSTRWAPFWVGHSKRARVLPAFLPISESEQIDGHFVPSTASDNVGDITE